MKSRRTQNYRRASRKTDARTDTMRTGTRRRTNGGLNVRVGKAMERTAIEDDRRGRNGERNEAKMA